MARKGGKIQMTNREAALKFVALQSCLNQPVLILLGGLHMDQISVVYLYNN